MRLSSFVCVELCFVSSFDQPLIHLIIHMHNFKLFSLLLFHHLRWRSTLLWRAFFTTAVVAVVLRALIDFCKSGKCGLFGKGGLIMFDVTAESVSYHLVDLPPVIVLGIIGGILGSLYNFLLDKVLRIYTHINEYDLFDPFSSMYIGFPPFPIRVL